MSLLGSLGGSGAFGSATVNISANLSQLQKDMAQAKGEVAAGTGQATKSAGLAKAAWLAAGTAVAVGVAKFVASSVKAAAEAERVSAQTANVIKSTGGVAKVSQSQVESLAHSIQTYSGIQDEVVQGGENLMLTFTRIRNEGEGMNAVFDRATIASADMAVALNQGSLEGIDLKGTTLQLGKALNDPISGMTALRRSGVNLTGALAKQITTLQKHGHLMQAQKLILGEVEKEFGGAAQAAGGTFEGSLKKAGAAWDDLKESVGKAVLPGLTKLAQWAAEEIPKMIPMIEDLVGAFGDVVGAVAGVGDALAENLYHTDALQEMSDQVEVATASFVAGQTDVKGFSDALGSIKIPEGVSKTQAWDAMRQAQVQVGNAFRQGKIKASEYYAALRQTGMSAEDASKEVQSYARVQKSSAGASSQAAKASGEAARATAGQGKAASGAAKTTGTVKKAVDDFVGSLKKVKSPPNIQIQASNLQNTMTDVMNLGDALANLPSHTGVSVGGVIGVKGLATGGMVAAARGMMVRRPTVLTGEGRYATPIGRGGEAIIPLDARGQKILANIFRQAMGDMGGGGHISGTLSLRDGEAFVEGVLRRSYMKAAAA